MAMNITIEELSDIHVKETATVMMQAFNYVDQGWTEESSLEYIKDIRSHAFQLIALKDDQIVGLVIGNTIANACVIDAIGVVPAEMKQGIATQLYKALEKRAKNSGCTNIKMIADPNSVAFKWYMKLGFQKNGWIEIEKKI